MSYSQTLYQKILGKDYGKLPSVLQEFHARPDGGNAIGTLIVQRGKGLIRALLARLLQLPCAGDNIPLRLQVIVRKNQEQWIRYFGEQRLMTLQWNEHGYLVEKAGPLRLMFQLTADSTGMTFNIQKNKIGIFTVPSLLMMRVSARATATDTGWNINVVIELPWVGVITTYSGTITPI